MSIKILTKCFKLQLNDLKQLRAWTRNHFEDTTIKMDAPESTATNTILSILLCCCSGILWGVSEIAVKSSCLDKSTSHVFIILVFRAAIQTVISFFVCVSHLRSLRPAEGETWQLILRASCESVNCISIYIALVHISPLEVTLIAAVKPFIVLILSYFWLKEHITKFTIALIILTILGVIMVCNPMEMINIGFTGSLNDLAGIGLVSLSNITASIYICCCRKLKNTHVLIVLFWLSLFSLVSSGILAAISTSFRNMNFAYDFSYAAIIAVSILIAEGLLTHSLRSVNATEIAIALNTQIPTTLTLQWAIFNLLPSWQVSLGGSVIIMCIILNFFQNQIVIKCSDWCCWIKR